MFDKKFLHLVEALILIAVAGEPVSAKAVCGYLQLPVRYLEPSLQLLVRAHILKGIRGPKGGYVLSREQRKVHLGEIYRLLNPEEKPAVDTSPLMKTLLIPVWNTARTQLCANLDTVTLEELVAQAETKAIALPRGNRGDFSI